MPQKEIPNIKVDKINKKVKSKNLKYLQFMKAKASQKETFIFKKLDTSIILLTATQVIYFHFYKVKYFKKFY